MGRLSSRAVLVSGQRHQEQERASGNQPHRVVVPWIALASRRAKRLGDDRGAAQETRRSIFPAAH